MSIQDVLCISFFIWKEIKGFWWKRPGFVSLYWTSMDSKTVEGQITVSSAVFKGYKRYQTMN